MEFVEFVEFVEFIGSQWRYGGDALETSRDALEMQWRHIGEIGDTVEISRDAFEIQIAEPE
jgi:hypothetical protein